MGGDGRGGEGDGMTHAGRALAGLWKGPGRVLDLNRAVPSLPAAEIWQC